MARLILDSTVLVAAERRGDRLQQVITDDDDVVIAAVTAAELLLGVELAGAGHREARRDFVENLLTVLPVEPYDLEVARAHAALMAHTRRTGRPRGAHDLMIAATAAARRRDVVSDDVTGFKDLPGVALASTPASRAQRSGRRRSG